MKIVLLENRRLSFLNLPNEVSGSFWITNPFKPSQKLINIEAQDGKWYMISNKGCYIMSNKTAVASVAIEEGNFYSYLYNNEEHLLYASSSYDNTVEMYQIADNVKISIGTGSRCNISCNTVLMGKHYAELIKTESTWTLKMESKAYVYINNQRNIRETVLLKNGSNLFILGINITILGNILLINKPKNLTRFEIPGLVMHNIPAPNDTVVYEEVSESDYYKPDDYFYKTPRLRRFITTFEIEIAPPPQKKDSEDTPMIILYGPMLTMGTTSIVSLISTLTNIKNKSASLSNAMPTLITTISMLASTLLWPAITRKYNRAKEKRQGRKQKRAYMLYLKNKEKILSTEFNTQNQILKDNFPPILDCYEIVTNKRRELWERKSDQKDFLTVRLGLGRVPLDANIQFKEDDFIVEEDELKKEVTKMISQYKYLPSAPITYSFYNKKVTAVMGLEDKLKPFIDNLILQLITFHSFDDLKLVVFTTENSNADWDYMKNLPHIFSNDRKIRFFSTNESEQKKINEYLEQEFLNRTSKDEETNSSKYLPYYLIISDDFISIRKLGIVEKILNNSENYGFGLFIRTNKLSNLPSECDTFINIDNETSNIMFSGENDNYQTPFTNEINDLIDMNLCSEVLANIPIEFNIKDRNLPESLGFLDMYGAGKIEQLNTVNNWRLNDPTKSLKALIGIDSYKSPIYLDLHEKAHGPHGLIAGTTGSGKSEFIITYILSMALNYSPNEVAFILIDYKGGGLAGAFENKKNNIRLPHLAGTITNLDKNELNRTLVSIDSELKRRQQKFNEAREELGESTMDIYKYQRLFREKKLTKPIPHLFIICDEFAELKSQQPDFMDNLISAARIGRSLGVHLILATQKPSGVVNDQIWSNTKFRVCLKVADNADSNEMIKKPDAATITNAGRFYLQVGYDEIYVLGQSGWSGALYYSKDIMASEIDRSISFIDNTGEVFKTVDSTEKKVKVEASGDELSNILKYIVNIATKENLKAENLWLENIPEKIYITNTIKKYNFTPNKEEVEAVIGEYDDPTNQSQNILTLKLNSSGNSIIYGTSGLGREMFIKALIYSTSILYSTKAINYYIFDFGSESLRIFEKLPHVADIVFANEPEKTEKMFKMILDEIAKRKDLFADYNGDYETYNKSKNTEKLPVLCVIINNLDTLKESDPDSDDILIKIARDGFRYGILMIITNSSQSGLYSRFLQNFSNIFVLDMNDKNDYVDYLGRIGNILPAEFIGRGLFKKDIAYEFQTATIIDDELLTEHIKDISVKLANINNYIPEKVPILPKIITFDMLFNKAITLANIPIGYSKENIEKYTYNFKEDKATIITSNNHKLCIPIVKNILKMLKMSQCAISAMIDFNETFVNEKHMVNGYFTGKTEQLIEKLKYFANEKLPILPVDFVLFITGFDNYGSLSSKNELEEVIKLIINSPKSTIILVDSDKNIKNIIYESWCNDNVNKLNGIWIGNDVQRQSILRINTFDSKYRAAIENSFAWIFNNDEGTLVKLINEEDANEE